ncbi:MAG: sodium:calcium antiporter [bacterium]|nr:sodium:calcium antiporter [bacterium]
MTYELAFNFLLIAVGMFILIRSGVYIVRSLVGIAHFLKVSEFTLSFILMAFATTLPEFAIGVNAAFRKESLISLGNILGANILTIGLVLGLVALISGRLIIHHQPKGTIIFHHWFTFLLGISPLILLIDLKLSRFDGLILIALFFANLLRLFHLKEIFNHGKSFWLSHFHPHGDIISAGVHPNRLIFQEWKSFLKNLFIFLAAAGFLLFSAYLIIEGAKNISVKIGMSQFLVGALIIALGTTLPELSFGIRAALLKKGELSLGNLFGATAFNSTWILGVVALISPIEISEPSAFLIAAVFMILALFLANFFLQTRGAISRKEGLVLVGISILFIITQIFL